MSANETLKALVDLQKIDVQILELEKDREQIPSRLKEIEGILDERRGSLAEEQNALAETEMSRRVLEGDLKAEKEKIRKWESRLNEIKSNRDYQALSRETEAARKANLGIEDEILKRMQDMEDLKISIGQKEEDLAELESKLNEERQELEGKLRVLDEGIEGYRNSRDDARSKVDDRWFSQYDMIRKRRDGVAVVAVVDEHCMGCHIGIPPQLYNIVLRGDEIQTCPFCHRILFYQQALDELDSEN
ncbi:MAG: hypothetical protein JRF33_04260 [Deltaproteobacteria bacterium]|nr:hypothetical protein [Deltaproteobacteria bacterium]